MLRVRNKKSRKAPSSARGQLLKMSPTRKRGGTNLRKLIGSFHGVQGTGVSGLRVDFIL